MLVSPAIPALAGEHTWRISEVYSNADGSVQFVEMKESQNLGNEGAIINNTITSLTNSRTFLIPSSVAAPTNNKFVLFATPGFASIPGAVTPDFTLPNLGMVVGNFFNINGDTIKFTPHDGPGLVFGLGVLPTDGINSLHRTVFTGSSSTPGVNSPTNYAGQTGSINLAPTPPAVPSGAPGSTPMTVEALDVAGTMLRISWDTTTCSGTNPHKIIYGEKSNLPSAPGGLFSFAGAVCSIGTTSPFVWDPVPASVDGAGMIWWLIVVQDGSNQEGSFGVGSDDLERDGPGANGSSDTCGATDKIVTNECGN